MLATFSGEYMQPKLSPLKKKVPLAPAAVKMSESLVVYIYGPSSKVRATVFGLVHLVMTWARIWRDLSAGTAWTERRGKVKRVKMAPIMHNIADRILVRY